MSDYISREAALTELQNPELFNVSPRFLQILRDLPAADVEPVRHGEWEPGNSICPVCGEDKFKGLDADIWSDWTPACCPNCGAKMDLEDENHDN